MHHQGRDEVLGTAPSDHDLVVFLAGAVDGTLRHPSRGSLPVRGLLALSNHQDSRA
ncbi:hypothetical protein [Streptomyces incarnatus]|uniref:hypothetical protein n=1 Tax=Streptomyces incarnatus TaxID=665007 RepID=UPI000A4614B3|nr:hypothetical protein [Streptomyces incarnatus]